MSLMTAAADVDNTGLMPLAAAPAAEVVIVSMEERTSDAIVLNALPTSPPLLLLLPPLLVAIKGAEKSSVMRFDLIMAAAAARLDLPSAPARAPRLHVFAVWSVLSKANY